MKINDRAIGSAYEPYIIAEMSNNHLKDLNRAREIIKQAAIAGADAVKIQTYTADSLTIDCDKPDFVIQDPLWKGKTYYDLYSEIAMPLEWTEILFDYARELGITLFSSPFDKDAVDLLKSLDCPAYKIASFEAQDEELLKAVAAAQKPVIMSTGISNLTQLQRSIDMLGENTKDSLALLHCISGYPSTPEEMNVRSMSALKELSPVVGLSDHSLSNVAAIASIALGGCVIEKHMTLARSDGGPDAEFSLEPHEFKALVDDCKTAWKALGDADLLESGKRKGKQHARSIYCVQDIQADEVLTSENIRVIRPGFGLPPVDMDNVLGRRALAFIEKGTALDWSLID